MPRPRASTALPVACVDFETYYDDDCSVTTLGVMAYLAHPKFDPYLVAIHGDGIEFTGEPKDFDWSRLDGYQLLAHNASFDEAIARRYAWGAQRPWLCTADLCAYVGIGRSQRGRSLKNTVLNGLGITISKSVRDDMKGKRWVEIDAVKRRVEIDAVKRREWINYAGEDARLSYQLWKKYSDQWPEEERIYSQVERVAGWRGLCVDRDLLIEHKCHLREVAQGFLKQIPFIDEDTGPAARKAFAQACIDAGVPPPTTRKKDDPTYLEWLETYAEKVPWAPAISHYVSVNKTLAFYETVDRRTLASGRVSYGVLYAGAHTLRTSGEGGLNMLNLNREPVFGAFTRNIFVPSKGKAMIASDLAQIEPRVAAYLAGEQDFLTLCRQGISPYIAHGAKTGRIPDPVAFNKARKINGSDEAHLYSRLKVEILAFQYGGGADMYLREAKKAGMTVTRDEAEQAVLDFRAARKGLVQRWATAWATFQRARSIGQNPILIPLLSGRHLRYFGAHSRAGNRKYPDWMVKTSMDDHKFTKIYAAKVFQNEVQAHSRDVLMDMRRRILAASQGLDYLLNVYDELVFEVDLSRADEALALVQREMSTPPAWAPDLPVACDCSLLTEYTK